MGVDARLAITIMTAATTSCWDWLTELLSITTKVGDGFGTLRHRQASASRACPWDSPSWISTTMGISTSTYRASQTSPLRPAPNSTCLLAARLRETPSGATMETELLQIGQLRPDWPAMHPGSRRSRRT